MTARAIRADARSALREGRRGALREALVCCCLPVLAALLVNLLYFALDRFMDGRAGGIGAHSLRAAYSSANAALYLLSIGASLIGIPLALSFKSVMLRRARRQSVPAGALKAGFRLFWRALVLQIITGVYIALWTCLLVVPGLIAAYRYRFAPYLLADHPDYTPSRALRESCRLTRGHKGGLLRLDLRFFYYYIPLGAAQLLMNLTTLLDTLAIYELSLPVLSYEQALAAYVCGALLACVCYALFAAHLTASTALFYDRIAAADAPEA